MKNILMIMLASILLISCYKDDNDSVISGTTTLTGIDVVPSVTTSATAVFKYSYNANNNQVAYQIDYTNLTDSATQFGISAALPGQTLPSSTFQLFNFSAASSLQRRKSGTYYGNFVIDKQQMKIEDLRAGKYCVYLRSKSFNSGSGELRGQIKF